MRRPARNNPSPLSLYARAHGFPVVGAGILVALLLQVLIGVQKIALPQ